MLDRGFLPTQKPNGTAWEALTVCQRTDFQWFRKEGTIVWVKKLRRKLGYVLTHLTRTCPNQVTTIKTES